ncbi:MAG: leucyl aminopeptidase [Candidatus Babeliales bacterium]
MNTITLSHESLLESKKQGCALFVEQDALNTQEIKDIAKAYFPSLTTYFKAHDFTGQAGKIVALPVADGKAVTMIFFVGLGAPKQKSIDIETFRRALGLLIKTLQRQKIDSCSLVTPEASLFSVSKETLAKEVAIISNMAAYHFDEYITKEDRKVNQNLDLTWIVKAADAKEYKKGLEVGSIIAKSINKVRHWIDLPPVALTPTELAGKAQKIAKEQGLKVTVFSEPEIKKMGMGGLAGVSAGSEQDCKFVILEYKAKKKNAPTIALVGKGITFDSGGLSLKPARYMETMKEDMSGAAAVIGTMEILAQLQPDVNVLGITPLSENLPSGKATKPGDILTFYNGMTAEVKNTDAEGRLILADALSYAVKHYKPDVMIDIATLTGACAYALGPFFTGIMGKHPEVLQKIKDAAKKSGDYVWELPFIDDYKVAIKSPVADMCNSGNDKYMAGAITAGFFLQNFVGETPWAHLDIAGTAFDVPDISYYGGSGATGVGVRLFVELVLNWR